MPKGGRGGNGGGGAPGGINPADVLSTRSLISERERSERAVDDALQVLSDVESQYGVVVEDMLVSKIRNRGGGVTLGYYDAEGNIGINEKVFANITGLNKTYDSSVKTGFHPSRGKKTGLQAVLAHELGHRLNYVAGGNDWNRLDSTADAIVKSASNSTGYANKTRQFRSAISGYATTNNAEAVAEAFADVYCNGNRAKKESRAVVNELNKYFGGNR